MSAGKQAAARFRIIDRCFTQPGQKVWTIDEIRWKMEDEYDIKVTKRTLERDFRAMRQSEQLRFYAPITYCPHKMGYYYENPNYSILKLPLTEDQLQFLEIASQILQRFQGMTFFSPMEEIVAKLSNTLKDLRHNTEKVKYPFIQFEEAAWQKGLELIEDLIQAIKNRQPLTIPYNPFGKKLTEHKFHPYFLKQYKQRWYLIGMSDGKKLIFPLALDRMKKPEPLDIPFKPIPISNPDEFFKNVIGISYAQATPENVVLSFTPGQGNYLKTQHLHHSQKILSDNEKEFKISLQIVPNYEFISLLMSYTPDVVVLEPESLKVKIQELFKKGLEKYE
ncbi:MAG TPA: WYL domain-containing protein [Cytophagales bacterium]|nr:WYL domain-containing protein [Cytophagales bacterium]